LTLSNLFSRRRKDESESSESDADSFRVLPTKAFTKFLSALGEREQPRLLDLGPVVGQNVTFFGEHLGCKIFVEDVFKDIERYVRERRMPELAAFFATRFPQSTDSLDGILCWDAFDYLDKPAGAALAQQLSRILKPDGVLLAFFSTAEPQGGDARYTKHIVVDKCNLKYRPYAAARPKQKPLLNRDIVRMFEPLRVTEQFLLKTSLREVLFRKPA
jgi:SAM-dependent methyltransferase